MSKIPFTLEAWLKDKSQKIETAFGEPAKIVFTEGLGKYPILAVIYDGDTTDTAWFTKDGKSHDGVYGLFFVTQEEELTEFETRLLDWLSDDTSGEISMERMKEVVRNRAAELLFIAREQFIKDGYIIEKKAFHDAVEKVDPEVMKEVSDKVDMEEALRLEYEKGKAEALKEFEAQCKVSSDIEHGLAYGLGYKAGKADALIDEITKLPGFKED